MISARVDVRTGWGVEFAREVNQQIARELRAATELGAQEAARVASRRRKTGALATIEAVDVIATPEGWEGGFRSKAARNSQFYSGFQSRGTLGRRTRKLKQATLNRRETPSGQARFGKVAGHAGIEPLGHEETGRARARRELIDRINRLYG